MGHWNFLWILFAGGLLVMQILFLYSPVPFPTGKTDLSYISPKPFLGPPGITDRCASGRLCSDWHYQWHYPQHYQWHYPGLVAEYVTD